MESREEEIEIASRELVLTISKMLKQGEDQEGRPFDPDHSDWQETLEGLIDEAREIMAIGKGE